MKARRIYFPILSLFITLCACLMPLFWFCMIMASSISPLPHPQWLTVCLRNSSALGRATLAGTGIAILGSLFTLWLLLKTDTPATARLHLKNIITGVLFGAGGGLSLGAFAMGMSFLQAFRTPGGLNQLGSLEMFVKQSLLGTAALAIGFGALCLIGMVVPYALITLVIRARQKPVQPSLPQIALASQPPHNPS